MLMDFYLLYALVSSVGIVGYLVGLQIIISLFINYITVGFHSDPELKTKNLY